MGPPIAECKESLYSVCAGVRRIEKDKPISTNSMRCPLKWLAPKLLPLGKAQINFAFRSFIRNFAPFLR